MQRAISEGGILTRQKALAERTCDDDSCSGPQTPPGSQRRRQRANSIPGNCRLINPKVGPLRTVGKLAQLFFRVSWWLGLPGRWFLQVARLLIFASLMMPFFIPFLMRYLSSPDIRKNVVYGPSIRHQLDVFLPCGTSEQKAPVVIFFCGGAWIIGYKLWAYIMGQFFHLQGVLFIAPDYRNFPQVTIGGMVEDVARVVHWTLDHIDTLNGDPGNVTLMGQSCGAHITLLALLEQVNKEVSLKRQQLQPQQLQKRSRSETDLDAPPSWSPRLLKRWIGISGPYDLLDLIPSLHARGLHSSVLRALLEKDVPGYSPHRIVRDLAMSEQRGPAVNLLPQVNLFHGTADATVDYRQSERLAEVLEQAGAKVTCRLYKGKSHTDPILEDACRGAGDQLMEDLLRLILPDGPADASSTLAAGQLPMSWIRQRGRELLLQLARLINPF